MTTFEFIEPDTNMAAYGSAGHSGPWIKVDGDNITAITKAEWQSGADNAVLYWAGRGCHVPVTYKASYDVPVKMINMPPHPVTVEGFETFPSQGSIRLEQHDTPAHDLNGIPVVVRRYGQSELPSQAEGTYYIVSQIVADAFPMRYDFVFPGDLIRDAQDNITGCKNLCRVP